jgi:putative component of toxin-antitoxin plasmid stabilization module
VYYTINKKRIIFLLAGGAKSTQPKGIEKALALLKTLEE